MIFMLLEDYLNYHYKVKADNQPGLDLTDPDRAIAAFDGQFRARFEIERLRDIASLLFPKNVYPSLNHDEIATYRIIEAAIKILQTDDYTNPLLIPDY
jgi:hypothetical protein